MSRVRAPWDDDEEHNTLRGQTLQGWGRDGMWHSWGGVAGEGAGGGAPAFSFPITPLVDLDSGDMAAVSNRYVPNRLATAADSNAIQLNTGFIQGAVSSGTATQAYANGPGGAQTALRLQLTSGSGIWDFYTRTLAADTTLQFKAKSTAGAGAQSFRYGRFTPTAVGNVDESGWTTFSVTIPSGASRRVCILHNSADADILIDEVQLEVGASAGAFASTPGHGFPEQVFDSVLTVTNGALDTSAAAIKTSLPLPSYPTALSFTQGTMWAIISTTNTGTATKIMEASGSEGTAGLGVSGGFLFGQPVLSRTNSNSMLRLVSKGYHFVAMTWKAGNRTLFIDGIPHTFDTATLATFSRSVMGFMCDPPNVAGSTWGSFGARGKLTKAGIVDQWMTDAQVQQLYQKVCYDHSLISGIDALVLPINFVIADGDSITNNGAYARNNFAALTTQTFGKITGVSGTTLQNVTTGSMARKADNRRRIQAAVALGHNVIFSVLHGANGTYSMAEAHALTDDMRTDGAKIVYCTPIHEVGDVAHNAIMDTLTANLIAEGSALYDGLARFDGVLTETVGVDYNDAVHPNAAGHVKLQTPWWDVVSPLIV